MKLFYTETYEIRNYQYGHLDATYVREYYFLGLLIHRSIKYEPWEK